MLAVDEEIKRRESGLTARHVAFASARKEAGTPVHHYATAVALAGILQSKTLWATQSDQLNDPGDSGYFLDHFRKAFLSRAGQVEGSTLDMDFQEGIRLSRRDTFVTSFCDDPDALSLWRAYADGGQGFSLGFVAYPTNPIDSRLGLLGPLPREVRYGASQHVSEEIHTEFEWAFEVAERSGLGELPRELSGYLIRWAAAESPAWKSQHYTDERELRWIVKQLALPEGSVSPAPMHYRVHARGSTPMRYVHIPFEPGELLSITIGPGRNFVATKAQLTVMLRHYGFDPDKIEIKQSEIPWT